MDIPADNASGNSLDIVVETFSSLTVSKTVAQQLVGVDVVAEASDKLTDNRDFLQEHRLLVVHGLDNLGSILGALSRYVVEFDGEAALFLALPRAMRPIESEVQPEAGQCGLNLFYILIFCENAKHERFLGWTLVIEAMVRFK